MLPHQPYSRTGADCGGFPCRYVTPVNGKHERELKSISLGDCTGASLTTQQNTG